MNTILIPVSIGELADKISILEIKAARIDDAGKRAHVHVELEGLNALWNGIAAAQPELAALKADLRAINELLTRRFGISHATIQIETGACADAEHGCADLVHPV